MTTDQTAKTKTASAAAVAVTSAAAAAAADAKEAKTAGVPTGTEEETANGESKATTETAGAKTADGAGVIKAGAEKKKRKETKKRVRRVGKTEPRKLVKLDETEGVPAASGAQAGTEPPAAEGDSGITRRVLSKHDEKWNAMFEKLLAFKKAKSHTLVPQCYHDDPRLGRWVHYQRVEYWIYQQAGIGKITPERIARLEGMGFEWDPQKAQWNMLFDKLLKFKETVGHCKVPKGYSKDTELANWVRNQRLEQANMKKGKKSRMTPERYEMLDKVGFKWSTTIAKKGTSKKSAKTGEAAKAAHEESTATPKQEEGNKSEEAKAKAAVDDPVDAPTAVEI